MANYKFNVETLYEKTDNGLDILKRYLNNCNGFDKALQNEKNHFQFRESDKSASAILIKNDKGLKGSVGVNYWRVKDFGGDFYTPISIAMEQSGLDFYPCLKMLYEVFNLVENATFFKATTEIKTLDDTDKRPLDWFNVVTKPHMQLDIIGTHITPELALEYDFFTVDYYEKIFINKKTKLKNYIKVTATEQFPIFCYMPDKTWCKTYAPFSVDKDYKHGYLGTKPIRHVYGLQKIIDSVDVKEIDNLNKQIKDCDESELAIKKRLIAQREELKIDSVIIASGGSDGLNVASLDYPAIWYNSESEQINYSEYEQLKKICKNIYNLPDVDESGVKYGYEVAENFWNLKSIWLPKEKLGTNGKDFRDWMKFYKKSDLKAVKFQFKNLLTGALKMKFFEHNSKRWIIKTSYLHYFLKIKGFHLYYPEKKYTEKTGEQEYIFIRINENIIEQFFPNDIRKFSERYLIEKGQPIEVIDLIKNTDQFNKEKLLSMDKMVLDTKSYTEQTQIFYFKNQFALISKEGIELKPYKKLKNNVWDYKIIDKNIFAEKPNFRHYKDDAGNDRVEILQHDCNYMNYLINGSRMFWRKELEVPFGDFTNNPELQAAKEKYHNENRFNLSATILSEEERIIQEKHFLNKCYGLGYMLHRFKIESLARWLYVMDDNTKESEDDSNGRSGKSLYFRGLDQLLKNFKYVDGKSKVLQSNSHLMDGFTKENDYIKIEDIDQNIGITYFYNWITGIVPVNPKTKKPYEVSFEDAGKMACTSNFGVGKIDQSTIGRLFFVSFSDYYHIKIAKYYENRSVASDFDNKDFFSVSWDDKQWNKLYFFLMECCQLYINNPYEELKAPQDNIRLTNEQASIGTNFMDWCNGYFSHSIIDEETKEVVKGNLNEYILRDSVQMAYNKHAGTKYAKTSTNFKSSLIGYCNMILKDKNGNVIKPKWDFNPIGSKGLDKKGLIKRRVGLDILEHFFIRTPDENVIEPVATPEQKQLQLGEKIDDLPF